MRKGIDIEMHNNKVKSLIEALDKSHEILKEHQMYDLKIDEIKIEFDYDKNEYFLKIRYYE